MIKAGHYVLSRDVKNPKPDRRSKDWDKLATWPAGARVYVREVGNQIGEPATVIEFTQSQWPSLHRIPPYQTEQYAAIAEALTPTDETFKGLLHRLDICDTYWILKALVRSGKISHADIEQAANR
jgi:hypothetical protein